MKVGTELILRGAIKAFETIAVEALALFGRDANQEIEKLRSMRIDGARFAFERRHENGSEFLECAELIGCEEVRMGPGDQVDFGNSKLRDFVGLPRVLASRRVGLGAGALLLGLGGQGRDGGCSQQIL